MLGWTWTWRDVAGVGAEAGVRVGAGVKEDDTSVGVRVGAGAGVGVWRAGRAGKGVSVRIGWSGSWRRRWGRGEGRRRGGASLLRTTMRSSKGMCRRCCVFRFDLCRVVSFVSLHQSLCVDPNRNRPQNTPLRIRADFSRAPPSLPVETPNGHGVSPTSFPVGNVSPSQASPLVYPPHSVQDPTLDLVPVALPTLILELKLSFPLLLVQSLHLPLHLVFTPLCIFRNTRILVLNRSGLVLHYHRRR